MGILICHKTVYQISCDKEQTFSKEYTPKAIINEYSGNNVPQLAQKYNCSVRSMVS